MEPRSETPKEPKSLAAQRILACCALAVLAIICVLPPHQMTEMRATLVAVGLVPTIAGFFHRGPGAAIAAVSSAFELLILSGLPWLLIVATGLVAILVTVRLSGTARNVWASRGSLPGWPTLLCAAVTPVFLFGWVVLLKPDVRDLARQVPDFGVPLLVLGSIAFAAANASFEEAIWRVLFQGNLTRLFPSVVAIAVQAVSFGIAHLYGFPRGFTGVVLATTWALMLGGLRAHSRGILAPVVAHFVADITIAQLLVFRFR